MCDNSTACRTADRPLLAEISGSSLPSSVVFLRPLRRPTASLPLPRRRLLRPATIRRRPIDKLSRVTAALTARAWPGGGSSCSRGRSALITCDGHRGGQSAVEAGVPW